jgi:colanic acid/amylovoran biosynthesis glycosyltransferase
MNWLYDHLRFVPRYAPVVFCDELLNREEFPALEAWCPRHDSLPRRAWGHLAGDRVHPFDWLRLKQLTPGLLHSHFGYVAVQDSRLQQSLQVPWLVSFYGADVYATGRQAEWREKYARMFDKATKVLALGPVMKGHLERLSCPRQKIVVHPLGVDVKDLPSRPRLLNRGEPLKLLFAGTFREKKGVQYVLEAAALARRAGVRFKLQLVGDIMGKPGDAETKEAIFQQISHLGLEDLVTYRSFLPFRELISVALDSHIFIAPSVTAADGDAEGTPFVLQQMMATGLPAIATVHSDIPYLFGEHAYLLVPERDADAIARRIQHYQDDPDSLATDGLALRDQIRGAFNVRKCAVNLSGLYDALLQN